jgi:putative endonuclease
MNLERYTRKDIGNLGERVTCEYLSKRGHLIVGRNIAAKTGELDVIAQKGNCLHFVEVKAVKCQEFSNGYSNTSYNPADNLHANKIRKVIKTAQWYIAHYGWEGEWQVDGALVWLRERDGLARIQYYPQVV